MRYLAAALAEGVTQDQIDSFELGLENRSQGTKIKRASAIVDHIFKGEDSDRMFLNMLNFIYFENASALQAFTTPGYKHLLNNVLEPNSIELGDDGYFVASRSTDSGTPAPSAHHGASGAELTLVRNTQAAGGNMTQAQAAPKSIFIVHGHDKSTVNDVRIEVNDLTGIMPEILADSAGRGGTIIEKFEKRAAESDYAIVVLTPDDEGRAKADASAELKARARQNVILELGYFYAKLGREKVAVIHHGVELPSDINGVNYIRYNTSTWMKELRTELAAAGFDLKR